MVRTLIGLALIMIGTMGADSENILLPVAMIAIGAWLMRKVVKE